MQKRGLRICQRSPLTGAPESRQTLNQTSSASLLPSADALTERDCCLENQLIVAIPPPIDATPKPIAGRSHRSLDRCDPNAVAATPPPISASPPGQRIVDDHGDAKADGHLVANPDGCSAPRPEPGPATLRRPSTRSESTGGCDLDGPSFGAVTVRQLVRQPAGLAQAHRYQALSVHPSRRQARPKWCLSPPVKVRRSHPEGVGINGWT
jgi:hypothetical protein